MSSETQTKKQNPFYRFFIAETSNTYLQAARYFLFGAIPTAVDMGLLWLFKTCFGQEYLLLWTAIAFIIVLIVFVWNFSMNKILLFRNKGKEKTSE